MRSKTNQYGKGYKKRLKGIVSTKMRTAFIGALAAFEKDFGYLWGHDLDEDIPLTEKQEGFLDVWEEVRAVVLDNGNNQLRSLMKELDNHDVKWHRYEYEFNLGEKNSG